ncbi:GNAT family acetyltransferase [Secundilactobacillus silagincola]|uniref:GNAT family acetyltransferase n=1 Tax=Secundilactobacillus silagincola TaxID=1714681 RepID=A0A1Z5J0C2_9LACO|nr:GNAT family N-acetyltransferase [Secundilactobacillus silagincola]GAX07487.1 GNAT family acetyltransferase [Secundilactobacillus silagincola]
MESIRIRHAHKNENFGAIRQVYYQTWLATYRTHLPNSILKKLTPTTWHPEQRWQDMQLAFNNEGKIVGVCTYGPARLASFSSWGEIYSIYVLPDYQHLGIGSKLVTRALKIMGPKYRHIYLEVLRSNNDAKTFYLTLGFSETKLTRSTQVPGGKLKTVIFSR